MASRRALAGGGIFVLLGVSLVDYQGSAGGLALIALFIISGIVGYHTGTITRGTLYGALVSVGLTVGAIILGALAITILIFLTTPQHGGWGFMAFGITASMLATPLGPLLAALVLGGAALTGGAGGLLGGVIARGLDLSMSR